MIQFMIARVKVHYQSPDDSLVLQLVSVSNGGHMITTGPGGRVRVCIDVMDLDSVTDIITTL